MTFEQLKVEHSQKKENGDGNVRDHAVHIIRYAWEDGQNGINDKTDHQDHGGMAFLLFDRFLVLKVPQLFEVVAKPAVQEFKR